MQINCPHLAPHMPPEESMDVAENPGDVAENPGDEENPGGVSPPRIGEDERAQIRLLDFFDHLSDNEPYEGDDEDGDDV